MRVKMSKKNTIEQDMQKLAKMIFVLSKKHGDIYVTGHRSEGCDFSQVTYTTEFKSTTYQSVR